jgi:gas vesicle protein
MSEFMFATKMLISTILLLLVMQIKLGSTTIEDQSYKFIKESSVTHWLQGAAKGGVIVIREGANKASVFLNEKFGQGKEKVADTAKDAGGRLKVEFSRSKEYIQQKAESVTDEHQ